MAESDGPRFQKAILVEHKILASKFHYFVLKTDQPLIFRAGQYISVKVADDRINAYSLAGSITNNQFELLVDVSPGGPGSKYFENLKTGEEISFLGPFGNFILQSDDGAEKLLFLGTGSGCSPLKCMLEAALREKRIKKPVYFYFGLRFEGDVFWQNYFEELAKEFLNFHYKLVLSKPGEKWSGLSGHVTDFIRKDFSQAQDFSAYLCGNKNMTEEAKALLLESGCPKNRIYKEEMF